MQPVPFARALRNLDTDSSRYSTFLLLTIPALLLLWTAWFTTARVGVYAVTASARLEVDREHHIVGAPVSGRVAKVTVSVGQRVAAGDVLLHLDATAAELARTEEQARLAPANSQIALLREELNAQQRAIVEEQQGAAAAVAESEARAVQARTAADFAAEEAARLETLQANGLISELEALRARNLATTRDNEARSAGFAASRVMREFEVSQQERLSETARLRREIAALEGLKSEASAAANRINYDIEQRVVRAPIDGIVAELTTLTSGSIVEEGDQLGTIVPDGDVRVVAFFPPSSALGRIASGQSARVKLEAFPWTQFGAASAVVSKVASEPQDGRVRVELVLDPEQSADLPLQHGLPAEVDIEVEQVSPAILVLRSLGAYTRVAAMQQ
ncbi:MAG: HlyD family secretion protein [Vicinamibacterales bacterium]